MQGRAVFGRAGAAAWTPSERDLTRSRLAKAMKRWGYDSLEALHRASVDKPDWFWPAASEDLGVTFTTSPTAVVNESAGRLFPRWFPGGRLNVAGQCVDRHAKNPALRDTPAVIYEADSGARRQITFAELGAEVERAARGLRDLGIDKGDRVGLFMPVIPEAAVALLACA